MTIQTRPGSLVTLLAAPALAAAPPADELEARLRQLMTLELAPAMSVAVVQDDTIVPLDAFGMADLEAGTPATPDTVFYIASATKPFTGTAFAILNERGEIDLDAPVSASLDGAVWHDDIDPDSITYRDLLTHTHGLDHNGPIPFRLAYSGGHTPGGTCLTSSASAPPPSDSGRRGRTSPG